MTVYRCFGTCLYSCGGRWSVSGVLFYPSPFYLLRQSLPLNLERDDSLRLADQEALCILLALPLQSARVLHHACLDFHHGCRRCKLRPSYLCVKHFINFINWDISPAPTTVYFKNNNKIQCITGAHHRKWHHGEVRLVTQILFSAQSWILKITLLLAPQYQCLAKSDLSETLRGWEAAVEGWNFFYSVCFQFLSC